MGVMVTHYDILGIDRNASSQEIKNAYRELMKHHHPDLHANSLEANRNAQRINTSYGILKDPVRRYEYDNLLILRMNPADSPPEDPPGDTTDEVFVQTDMPHYICEGCGRSDPSLRVTIFSGIISFIVFRRTSWGRILCSRCRMKYSLLWNLEVWFAGWWSIPFGPWYSVAALAKNATGGTQPEENNALLLASLAHDYYVEQRYSEAYQALQESLKLRMTKGGLEFRAHLIAAIRKNDRTSTVKKPFFVHPLVVHIPVLTALAALFIWIGALVFPGTSTAFLDPNENSAAVPAVEAWQSQGAELQNVASMYGIDVGVVDRSMQVCCEAKAIIAQEISSHPVTGDQSPAEPNQKKTYVVNWPALDGNILTRQKDNVYGALTDASTEVQKLSDGNPPSADPSVVRGRSILTADYDELVATFFNCSILEFGASFMAASGVFQDEFPGRSVDGVSQLSRRQDVATWLTRSGYMAAYQKLIEVLQTAQAEHGRYREARDQLKQLLSVVREDSTTLATLQQRMDQYKSQGAEYDYTRLANVYNDMIPAVNQHLKEYNEYHAKYTEIIGTMKNDAIGEALLGCMDPLVFFPESSEKSAPPEK